MKISNRTIASLGLILAVLLTALWVLASMRKITPDLILRSTLREVVLAAEKKESPERLRELALKGLESASEIERTNSKKDDWSGYFFAGAIASGALSLLIIALRKKEANQALVPTPMSVTPAASAPVAPATGAAHL